MIFGPWFETELYSTGHTADGIQSICMEPQNKTCLSTDKLADLSASASFLNIKDRPKNAPDEIPIPQL